MSDYATWRRLSPADDDAIRQLAGKLPKSAISARLEISESALHQRAKEIGVAFPRRVADGRKSCGSSGLAFSPQEQRIVRENIDKLTYSEIARLIGRSRNSVAGHIYRLKRKQRRAP